MPSHAEGRGATRLDGVAQLADGSSVAQGAARCAVLRRTAKPIMALCLLLADRLGAPPLPGARIVRGLEKSTETGRNFGAIPLALIAKARSTVGGLANERPHRRPSHCAESEKRASMGAKLWSRAGRSGRKPHEKRSLSPAVALAALLGGAGFVSAKDAGLLLGRQVRRNFHARDQYDRHELRCRRAARLQSPD